MTQLGSNSFQITWWQGDEASANEGFATPIVVRLAPPLLHELQSAPEPTAAQKVHALGGDLRSGLAGYDPWSGKAHTIVLR